jgi:hypothetical protein
MFVTKIVANYICNRKQQVKKYKFSSSELNWISNDKKYSKFYISQN